MSVVSALVTRVDSWVNALTGLGTLRDKLMHAQVVQGAKLADGTLESLFNDDDIARRVVTKLPREATRRGFKIVLEGDEEAASDADVQRDMDDRLKALDAITKLRDSWIWARLYGGGSGVFVGADDGQAPDKPLAEERIRTIEFLNVVKRPQITIKSRHEDVTSPHFGEPELYTVHPGSTPLAVNPRGGIDIHASRMILFPGVLTAQQTQTTPSGWDDSILQSTFAPLQQSATAWQSVAHLMTDASQGVLKIANLVDLIASGGQEALRTRIQMMDLARSVCRAILVDAEREEFQRVSTSFAGLPEVMDRLMMRVGSAAEMPVTLLFGRSPAGLNATGESDIRGWYDTVADAQGDVLKPRLERLLRLIFAAKDSPTRGRIPERWCIEFNPLWQPTDKELADTKKVKADTYVALVGAQIMTDAEAGIGLAADFPTIDVEARQALADADAEEGLRPREVNTPPPEPEDDPEGGDGGDEPRGDSTQPRHPAGSPQGGQFAPAGGATSAGRADTGRRIEQEIGAGTRRHANTEVVVMTGTDYGAGAAHQPSTGKIFVSEAHAALLAAPRPTRAGKLQEAYDRAAHVFVHEELHAYGPYPQAERRAKHLVLEEVTTDLVASRITGHPVVYANNVQRVKDAIAQTFEVDDATAHEIASEASRRYKGHADAAEEAHELFARLAATDPTKGSALAARLAKMGGGSPDEEPEAVDAGKKLTAPVRAWMKKQSRKDDDDLRDDGWSSQVRAPKGSPQGGQWTSTGGGGKAKAKGSKTTLTAAQREAIRAAVKSGTDAGTLALQAKIQARFGAGKQGVLAWERELKAQLKAAKAQRAQKALGEAEHKALMKTAGTRAADEAARHARAALEAGHEIAHAKQAADKAAAKALGEAEHKAKQAHEHKRWAEQESAATREKAAILQHHAVVEAAALAKVKPAKKSKPKKTTEQLKAELEAKQQKTAAMKAQLAEQKQKTAEVKAQAKAAKAAAKAAKEAALAEAAAKVQAKIKAAQEAKKTQPEAGSLEAWEKQQQAKWAQQSLAPGKKKPDLSKHLKPTGAAKKEWIPFEGAGPGKLAGSLIKGGTAAHGSKHASEEGLQRSVRGPLQIKPSPHAAEFEQMAKQSPTVTSFKVVEGVRGKAIAEQAHKWKSRWVGHSTEEDAEEVLKGIDNPNHHVHAQYHATQALLREHMPELQKRGIVDADGYVTLYRGVKNWGQGESLEQALTASKDGSTNLTVRGTSSWSASHEVARSFAHKNGVVVQQKVHVSNALVVHNFEPKWHLKEIEWALISRDKNFKVVRADESVHDPY